MKQYYYSISCLFFFLVLSLSKVQSQSKSNVLKIDSPIERHRWEIATNIFALPHLMRPLDDQMIDRYWVKYNIGEGKNLGALRFSIMPVSSVDLIPGVDTLQDEPKSTIKYFQPMVVLGIEKQILSGKFGFYYGFDVKWHQERRKRIYKTSGQSGADIEDIYNQRRNTWVLKPFIGAKYFINHRISISHESGIDFSYQKGVHSNVYNSIIRSSGNSTHYNMSLNLFKVLCLSYHL